MYRYYNLLESSKSCVANSMRPNNWYLLVFVNKITQSRKRTQCDPITGFSRKKNY